MKSRYMDGVDSKRKSCSNRANYLFRAANCVIRELVAIHAERGATRAHSWGECRVESLERRQLLSSVTLSQALAAYNSASKNVNGIATTISNAGFGESIPLIAPQTISSILGIAGDLQSAFPISLSGLGSSNLPSGFTVASQFTSSPPTSGTYANDLFAVKYQYSAPVPFFAQLSSTTGFSYLDDADSSTGGLFGELTTSAAPTVNVTIVTGVDLVNGAPQFFIQAGGAASSGVSISGFSASTSVAGSLDIGELGIVSASGVATLALTNGSLQFTDPHASTDGGLNKVRWADIQSSISKALTTNVNGTVTITGNLKATLPFLSTSIQWSPSFTGNFTSSGFTVGSVNLNPPNGSSLLASLGQSFLSWGSELLNGGAGSAVFGPLSILTDPLPVIDESIADLTGLDGDLPSFPSLGSLSPSNVIADLYSAGFEIDDLPNASQVTPTVLEDMVTGLINGQNVDLISWSISNTVPLVDLGITIPIYSLGIPDIASLDINGTFALDASLFYHFGLGLSTQGVYFDTGPLLGLTFSASAGIEGDLEILGFDAASAGGSVGLSISPSVTLTSPSWDTNGRVYGSDMALFGSNPITDFADSLGFNLQADFTGEVHAELDLLFWSKTWKWSVDVPVFNSHINPTWPATNPNSLSAVSTTPPSWTALTVGGVVAHAGQNIGGGTLVFNDPGAGDDDVVHVTQGANKSVTVAWISGGPSRGVETFTDVGAFQFIGGSGSNQFTVGPNFSIPIIASSADTSGNSTLLMGGSGGSTLTGGAGSDTLIGGTGNDNINGGSGSAVIYGGGGNDTLTAGTGNTEITSSNGNSLLLGGPGNDTLNANGNDTIFGGTGDFLINGGVGNDDIFGYAQNGNQPTSGTPTIHAGSGKDVIHGGAIPMEIFGDTSKQSSIYGGSGADTLHAGSGGGSVVEGAPIQSWMQQTLATNIDSSIIGSVRTAGLRVGDEVAGAGIQPGTTISSINAGTGQVTLSQVATATSAGTVVTFGGNQIFGGGSGDTLIGGGGNNIIWAGPGSETIYGGAGTDATVNSAKTGVNYIGGTPASTGSNQIVAGPGSDVIFGDSSGHNTLDGGAGNVTLYAGDGGDYLAAGIGVDALYGGRGDDELQPNFFTSANDTLMGGGGLNTLVIQPEVGGQLPGPGNLVDAIGTSNTTIVVSNGNAITPAMIAAGYVIQIDNEEMLVTNASPTVVTGGVTKGLNTLTNVSQASSLLVGEQVSGSGIGNGTYITATSGSNVTLSAASTATATSESLTFSGKLVVQRAYGGTIAASHAGASNNFMTLGPLVQVLPPVETVATSPNYYIHFSQVNPTQFTATLSYLTTTDTAGSQLGSIGFMLQSDVEQIAIEGGPGNNVIKVDSSVTRNMYLAGGDGNNTLYAGSGNDTLVGGRGTTVEYGGSGNCVLYGGSIPWQIQSPLDSRFYSGGATTTVGHNTLVAGTGNDELFAGNGGDLLIGGSATLGTNGIWTLGTGAGHDVLTGGPGNDLLVAGPGSPGCAFRAGSGNDTLVGGPGQDIMQGGIGNDQLVNPVNVGQANPGYSVVSGGNDLILGGNLINIMTAGVGNDTLVGGNGTNYEIGGTGGGTKDVFYGTPNATYWSQAQMSALSLFKLQLPAQPSALNGSSVDQLLAQLNDLAAPFGVLTPPSTFKATATNNSYTVSYLPTATATGRSVIGGDTLQNLSSTASISAGEWVTGPGIPAGTFVEEVDSQEVRLSADATTNFTGTFNFYTQFLSGENVSSLSGAQIPAGTTVVGDTPGTLQFSSAVVTTGNGAANFVFSLNSDQLAQKAALADEFDTLAQELQNTVSAATDFLEGASGASGSTSVHNDIYGNPTAATWMIGGDPHGNTAVTNNFYNYNKLDTIQGGGGGDALVFQVNGSIQFQSSGNAVSIVVNGGSGNSGGQSFSGLQNVMNVAYLEAQTLGTGGARYTVSTTAGSTSLSGLPRSAATSLHDGDVVAGLGVPVGDTIKSFTNTSTGTTISLTLPLAESLASTSILLPGDSVYVASASKSLGSYKFLVLAGSGNDIISIPTFDVGDSVSAGTGNDVIQIGAGNASETNLLSSAGNAELDVVGVGNDAFVVNGNQLQITDTGGSLVLPAAGFTALDLFGGSGSDTFTSSAPAITDIALVGGTGTNSYTLTGPGEYTVIGNGAANSYTLNCSTAGDSMYLTQSGSTVTVTGSVSGSSIDWTLLNATSITVDGSAAGSDTLSAADMQLGVALNGQGSNNTLYGGAGADSLYGGAGDENYLSAGNNSDVFYFSGGNYNDYLGTGSNTIIYQANSGDSLIFYQNGFLLNSTLQNGTESNGAPDTYFASGTFHGYYMSGITNIGVSGNATARLAQQSDVPGYAYYTYATTSSLLAGETWTFSGGTGGTGTYPLTVNISVVGQSGEGYSFPNFSLLSYGSLTYGYSWTYASTWPYQATSFTLTITGAVASGSVTVDVNGYYGYYEYSYYGGYLWDSPPTLTFLSAAATVSRSTSPGKVKTPPDAIADGDNPPVSAGNVADSIVVPAPNSTTNSGHSSGELRAERDSVTPTSTTSSADASFLLEGSNDTLNADGNPWLYSVPDQDDLAGGLDDFWLPSPSTALRAGLWSTGTPWTFDNFPGDLL